MKKFIFALLLCLAGCNIDKEGRACAHVIELSGLKPNAQQQAIIMDGCRKGAQNFRVYRGEDAYKRHLDCALMAENWTQATMCDTIQ